MDGILRVPITRSPRYNASSTVSVVSWLSVKHVFRLVLPINSSLMQHITSVRLLDSSDLTIFWARLQKTEACKGGMWLQPATRHGKHLLLSALKINCESVTNFSFGKTLSRTTRFVTFTNCSWSLCDQSSTIVLTVRALLPRLGKLLPRLWASTSSSDSSAASSWLAPCWRRGGSSSDDEDEDASKLGSRLRAAMMNCFCLRLCGSGMKPDVQMRGKPVLQAIIVWWGRQLDMQTHGKHHSP